jgi:hypothetical protein
MEKWVSLEFFYMGNRVSSSIITNNQGNFEIIREGKIHYPICKEHIGA